MKNGKNIPVDLWVVKIDDTRYWSKDVLKKYPEIKRIFSIYMVDLNEYTYVASLTPSYFMRWLANDWTGRRPNEKRAEEIFDLMLENPGDDTYMNVGSIKNAPKIKGEFPRGRIGRIHWHTYTLRELREEFDGNREEAMEEAIEQYQGNPI